VHRFGVFWAGRTKMNQESSNKRRLILFMINSLMPVSMAPWCHVVLPDDRFKDFDSITVRSFDRLAAIVAGQFVLHKSHFHNGK
jgi:hypothetical protein